MLTFSIYDGQNIESVTYNIIGATQIDNSSLLNSLPDNKNKEISPKDLRNSIATALSTVPFKETTASQSSISYIGFDTYNPDETLRDPKLQIYFGKRAFSATFSYSSNYDIMNSSLLTSDTDLFFYNTKLDSVNNDSTKITFLSGTNSDLNLDSPFIQTQKIISSNLNEAVELNLINPTFVGGTESMIKFYSDYGTVSFNNVVFPRPQSSLGLDLGLTAASNDRVLTWENGQLVWSDIVFPNLSFIGTTGSATNIFGNVFINDFPINFTDTNQVTANLGDIKIGDVFSNVSLSEMLKRIIYPYSAPECTLDILPPYDGGISEVGTAPTVILKFTIKKKTLPTLTTTLSNMLPGTYPAITNSTYIDVTSTANGVVITPITSATTSFSINVTDGTQSNSASTTIKGIYPYFYGFSGLSTMTTAGLANLIKKVEPKGDKVYDFLGSGNIYFIYDSDYPVLSNIYDELGNIISGSFSYSLLTLSSPTGLWASKEFRVYQWNAAGTIDPPSVNFEFKY